MTLRFKVNQAEAFRRGIDVPKSIVTVDVIPSELDQDARNLIADRLEGIEVTKLSEEEYTLRAKVRYSGNLDLIEASEPTLEGLLAAVRANEAAIMSAEKKLAATTATVGTR